MVVDLSLLSVALGPPPRIRIGGVVSVVCNTASGRVALVYVGIACCCFDTSVCLGASCCLNSSCCSKSPSSAAV